MILISSFIILPSLERGFSAGRSRGDETQTGFFSTLNSFKSSPTEERIGLIVYGNALTDFSFQFSAFQLFPLSVMTNKNVAVCKDPCASTWPLSLRERPLPCIRNHAQEAR